MIGRGGPLFATGAGSNSGSYSLAVFHQFATYAAQQLPYIWVPNPEPYEVMAVNSKLHNVTFNTLFTMLPEYGYFTK